jgi:hypothetical protein
MAESYSGPKLADIRKRLGELVTVGMVPEQVADVGEELLELEIVSRRVKLSAAATEEEEDLAYATALTSLLREAVEPLRPKKYRRLLKCVLPLKKELLGKSIDERREAAAKAFNKKGGKEGVKPGTIRTYHEPRALDKLAQLLIEMETDFRGEVLVGPGSDSD